MEIKAILLDFDGTSLQRDQTFISLRNMSALRRAMDKGIEIIPCTGRCEDMFPPQIEAEPRIHYWVTSGGARVVNRSTKEVICQSLFTPEESARLCRIYENQSIYSEISAQGRIYMEREVCSHLENFPVPPHHVWFMETGRQLAVDTPSAYFLDHGISAEKFNIYGVPEQKQQEILDRLERTDIVHITEGAGTDIQFFPKRLSRKEAIEALLGRLGIGFGQVMSIGDAAMDAPLIREAAIGVAVGNAPDWLKAEADYVAAPYYENGVAEAVEKYLL